MAIIEPISGTDYPTLPFKIQQAGYSTRNSNDFNHTSYNGAPGRNNSAFLNGWKTANFTILFRNLFEQTLWQEFYDLDYNGTTGGLEKGVSPFFAFCQLGGEYGKFLCQLTDAEWQVSQVAGFTAQLKLTVEVNPESFADDAECRHEVFSALVAGSVPASQTMDILLGIKDLTEIGMTPINSWQ
ncbi:hypothetical protein [Shewanella chilikensis]|uniref:hypothetical protein n=1 Tax=Shewanella chilikensis TaxID=558541 RepID=UPI003A97ACB2